MKYCNNCHINVDTNKKYCPLCYERLKEITQKCTPEKFNSSTTNPMSKKRIFIIKLLIFLNVIALVIVAFINFKLKTEPWSLIVTISCIYIWDLIEHMILSHDTAFKKVFFQFSIIFLLMLTISLIYGDILWVVEYVFPSISMFALLFMFIYLICDKKRNDKLFSFFSIDFLLMIVSIVFVSANVGNYFTINQLNITVQALAIFAYLLFGWKIIKNEFIKKFHI